MCGIAGEIARGRPADLVAIAAMTDAMAPRGPDSSGVWASERVAFGHRRLALCPLQRQLVALGDKLAQKRRLRRPPIEREGRRAPGFYRDRQTGTRCLNRTHSASLPVSGWRSSVPKWHGRRSHLPSTSQPACQAARIC